MSSRLHAAYYVSQDIQTVCGNAEVKLIYLPPYSPDLNSIEEGFAQLKAWFKKNYKLVNDMTFDEFLGMGINLVKDRKINLFEVVQKSLFMIYQCTQFEFDWVCWPFMLR